MSLTDPTARPWNRQVLRLRAAWACWALGGIAVVLLGITAASQIDGDQFVVVSARADVMIGLGGIGLIGIGIVLAILSASHDDFSPWWIVVPISVLLGALGVGDLAQGLLRGAGIRGSALGFLVPAVAAPVVTTVLVRRHRRLTARSQTVISQGRLAGGRIVSARSYALNHVDVTKVTVRFSDERGRSRFVTGTIAGRHRIGDPIKVRHLPEPGKASVEIVG